MEKVSHFLAGVWGPGAAPPISMTSWLPSGGASGAPFEAFPQKPHPLERRVKNTELEIASPRATCRGREGCAVTPPRPQVRQEGGELGGAGGGTHAHSRPEVLHTPLQRSTPAPPLPPIRALRSNLDLTRLNPCLIQDKPSRLMSSPPSAGGVRATSASHNGWDWFSWKDPPPTPGWG